jgi:hypothetical protein
MKINFRRIKVKTAIDGEVEEFDVAKTVGIHPIWVNWSLPNGYIKKVKLKLTNKVQISFEIMLIRLRYSQW